MRTTTRLLAPVLILVLAIAAVAMPATAFAQSAGDEQYVDPFETPDQGGNGGNGGNSGNPQGGGGDEGSAPAEDQVAQAPADTGDPAASTAGESSGTALPNTGLMLGGVALTGALLLGGGIALRRLWPPPN
jgi:hypothetical protein